MSMDYEFKFVLAIFLLMKTGTFFTGAVGNVGNGNQTESREQKLERSDFLQRTSLGNEKSSNLFHGLENLDKNLDWDSGWRKLNGAEILKRKSATYGKKIYSGENLKLCDRIAELRKGPVKWSEIQRTLHLMHWLFASGKIDLGKCYRSKSQKKKFNSSEINENSSFPLSKKESRNFIRRISGQKKRRNHVAFGRAKDLLSSTKSNIYGEGKGKIWKERKYKVKSLRNRFGRRRKNHDGGDAKRFRVDEDFDKNSNFSSNTKREKEFLKPKSVFREPKKNFRCQARRIDRGNPSSPPELEKKCAEVGLEIDAGKKWESFAVATMSGKTVQKSEGVAKEPQATKNQHWPHFIYHRVSSNFLHPPGKNESNRPSAYVAISVANDQVAVKMKKKKEKIE